MTRLLLCRNPQCRATLGERYGSDRLVVPYGAVLERTGVIDSEEEMGFWKDLVADRKTPPFPGDRDWEAYQWLADHEDNLDEAMVELGIDLKHVKIDPSKTAHYAQTAYEFFAVRNALAAKRTREANT